MGKKNFNASLDEQLILELKMQALREKRNVSDILEQLAKEYLEKQKVLDHQSSSY